MVAKPQKKQQQAPPPEEGRHVCPGSFEVTREKKDGMLIITWGDGVITKQCLDPACRGTVFTDADVSEHCEKGCKV